MSIEFLEAIMVTMDEQNFFFSSIIIATSRSTSSPGVCGIGAG